MDITIRGTMDEWSRIKPLYPNNKTIEDRISGDRSVSFYPSFEAPFENSASTPPEKDKQNRSLFLLTCSRIIYIYIYSQLTLCRK